MSRRATCLIHSSKLQLLICPFVGRFHEDNIGSLFSIRGPRDAGALLDVERAFNKLEKVALKRRQEVGRPLILIFNSMHLLRDDDGGKDLLELIQQRAEQWSASNLATVIFNSGMQAILPRDTSADLCKDDYWIYERLKQYATRMNVIRILDLDKQKALAALRNYRTKYRNDHPSESILKRVYDLVGGRMSYLYEAPIPNISESNLLTASQESMRKIRRHGKNGFQHLPCRKDLVPQPMLDPWNGDG